MDLDFNEEFVVRVFREFDFLRELGYDAISVSIHGRDPYVTFESKRAKRKISISWEGGLLIIVERTDRIFVKNKERIFTLHQYYDLFKAKKPYQENDIGWNAEFLKSSLGQLINGKEWVDDLLKH